MTGAGKQSVSLVFFVALALAAASACSQPGPSTPEGDSVSTAEIGPGSAREAPIAERGPSKARSSAAGPVPSDVPASVEGANVTMGTSTIDGLAMRDIQCRTNGQLFAAMTILGSLAQHKQAFDACSTRSESVRVYFATDGGRAGDVRVAGASSPAVARCVADAVGAATYPSACACALSIAIGPPAAP